MNRAVIEAAKGLGSVEPNPLVGAVVVRDGQIIGVGHHERFGGPHAEINALRDAGPATWGATLYITLEPCCHFGKTPPCTDAICAAGVARVVVAMNDPFPQVNGNGVKALKAAGIAVTLDCEAEISRTLNAPYLKRLITGMPFVTAKWAMTLDGKTATATGDSRWISSEQSRALVHKLRGRMDAIVVGVATAEFDDPLLTARPPGPRTPARIVLDSTARLPLTSRLVQTARDTPVIVAVTDRATAQQRHDLAEHGCEVVAFPGRDRVRIASLLSELCSRGMTNVLVEGGGHVLGSFLDEGQIDAAEVFVAPVVEGGDHDRTPARGRGNSLMRDVSRLRRVEVSRVGGDIHLRGIFHRPWRISAGFHDE
jgi:diaminohydroxyphosphoribosylaminopyrimidine deaminase/5-amino-6-(5-phosphoribosylamino)uracil reductase